MPSEASTPTLLCALRSLDQSYSYSGFRLETVRLWLRLRHHQGVHGRLLLLSDGRGDSGRDRELLETAARWPRHSPPPRGGDGPLCSGRPAGHRSLSAAGGPGNRVSPGHAPWSGRLSPRSDLLPDDDRGLPHHSDLSGSPLRSAVTRRVRWRRGTASTPPFPRETGLALDRLPRDFAHEPGVDRKADSLGFSALGSSDIRHNRYLFAAAVSFAIDRV